MKIDCCIAKDLMMLYLDDNCTTESKKILETHLDECPKCKSHWEQLQNKSDFESTHNAATQQQLSFHTVTRKLRKHKIRTVVFAVIITTLIALILSLCFLTLRDMHIQANPTIYPVEYGTYNLTDLPLNILENQVDEYTFFTNTTKIQVKINYEGHFSGKVMLWDSSNTENYIQLADVDENNQTCLFTGLTSARRYRISCEGLQSVSITVSEGRVVNFFNSLKNVLSDLISMVLY